MTRTITPEHRERLLEGRRTASAQQAHEYEQQVIAYRQWARDESTAHERYMILRNELGYQHELAQAAHAAWSKAFGAIPVIPPAGTWWNS